MGCPVPHVFCEGRRQKSVFAFPEISVKRKGVCGVYVHDRNSFYLQTYKRFRTQHVSEI